MLERIHVLMDTFLITYFPLFRVHINQSFLELRSAYTRKKISSQSDIPAVILFDWFSTKTKQKGLSLRERESVCGMSVCVHVHVLNLWEWSRVFAGRAPVVVVWMAV